MGQIVGGAAKPKRCNLNKLSQLGTPAAGEYILVSSDNSMNAAGQGNFDCYIVGDGRTAATALPLIKTYANDADDEPTAGSDKLVKSGGVSKIIDGEIEIEKTYEIQNLTANKYINTKTDAIGGKNTLSGTYCQKFTGITEGDKYRITGVGSGAAVLLWAWGDANNNWITPKSDTNLNTRESPITIEAPLNATQLIVNLSSYDSSTDKVEKVIETKTVTENGLRQRIEELENKPAIIIQDNLISENANDALSAKQGKVLNEKIEGVDVESETVIEPLISGKYYNTTPAVVGEIWDYGTSSLNTAYCKSISVTAGQVYHIYGYANNGKALRQYVLLDSDKRVLYIETNVENSRINPTVVNIEEDGYMIVNLANYDSSTDKIELIEHELGGGIKQDIANINSRVTSLENQSKPLTGKTFVAFGDSITMIAGDYDGGKRWTDYFEDITGASVINVAIGGTRLYQRRISSSIITDPTATGYDNVMNLYSAVDIINMVRASCGMRFSDNFTYLELAQQFAQDINEDAVSAVDRLSNVDWNDVDGVIILGGANDWFSGNTYPGESGSKIGTSTLGAVNIIIESLLSTYKHLNIFWVTPYVTYYSSSRTSEDWCDNKVLNGMTGKQLISAIVNEVTLNHIPVCDLYNTLGWNEYNFSQYFRDTDNHHAYKGFRNIAEKIAAFIVCNKNL